MTGASRGLGCRIGAALAAEGAEVALLSRNAGELEEVARAIGPAAHAFPSDIGDPDSVRRTFAQVAERLGGLDILVNNAAVAFLHTIEQATDSDLQAEVVTNLLGPIYCIRAAIPLMRAVGGGDVVNVSSVSVTNPFPMNVVYAATKAALETLSLGLNDELRGTGIRMSVLRSGSIGESTFRDSWSKERETRAWEMAEAAGRAAFTGALPVQPELLADWIVAIVALPPTVRVGVLELRPS